MILPQSRLSRLTLASLATLLGAIGAAHADPVLTATSSASAGTGPTLATPSNYVTTGYVNSNSYVSNSEGVGNGYSFANATGAYAVSVNAQGIAIGNALASFSNTFTNTTGVAQHYLLSFHIYGGYIATNNIVSLSTGETLWSSYKATVKTSLNGGAAVEKFASSATMSQNDGGYTLTRSGVNLTGTDDAADGYYSWSNDYYTVDLGIVAAGDSFDVLAEVENMAFADVGTYDFGGGGGYGYGCNVPTANSARSARSVAVANCTAFKGGSSSFYGDPIDVIPTGVNDPFGPNGFALTSNAVADLPEPTGMALVGVGLAAAAAVARRRRQR